MNRITADDPCAIAPSPLGPIGVTVDGTGRVVRIELGVRDARCQQDAAAMRRCDPVLRQLAEYFAGKRRTFALELAPVGTPFQLATWRALQAIPWGRTRSYAQLAEAIGRPTAVRAVGGANGANPLPIVVPCHRVIAADGSIGGFSGGIDRKRWLLAHEGIALRG